MKQVTLLRENRVWIAVDRATIYRELRASSAAA
jgi:hypothetical protein